jgi:prefoldin subunit 5
VVIKESEIQSLLAELRAKDETIKNLDKQIANLSEQNAEKDKVIKALKVKSFLKSSIGGVIILALTAVVLL